MDNRSVKASHNLSGEDTKGKSLQEALVVGDDMQEMPMFRKRTTILATERVVPLV